MCVIDHPGFHSETICFFHFAKKPTLARSQDWHDGVLGLKSPSNYLPVMPWVRWVRLPTTTKTREGDSKPVFTFSSERKYQGVCHARGKHEEICTKKSNHKMHGYDKCKYV